MYRKNMKGWIKHWDFVLLDLVCLQISCVLAYLIRMGQWNVYGDPDYITLVLTMTVFAMLEISGFSTFSDVLRRSVGTEIRKTVKHTIIVFAAVSLFLFSLQTGEVYSRIMVYVTMVLYFLLSLGSRFLYRKLVTNNMPKRAMYVVASGSNMEETLSQLRGDGTFRGIEICGAAVIDVLPKKAIKGVKVEALSTRELLKQVSQERVDEVFINLPAESPELKELREKIAEMGITLHLPVKKRSADNVEQIVENIGGYTVVTTSLKSARTIDLLLKRCMDILGGLVGCLATGLVLLIIGPIMKKQSPGPLIFKQERIGLNGKRFKMYKIRSMVMNAEELKKDLMTQNRVGDGMMFKLDWDPRIIGNRILPDGTKKTGIGELIRKTSLDEFPQFFNVLKGDMSLVGTRPPTVDEWEKYELHHRARMATKPGITGMWQVSGRSGITDFEEVVRLDTEYINNWSLGLDVKILLKTVKSVLKHDGAM